MLCGGGDAEKDFQGVIKSNSGRAAPTTTTPNGCYCEERPTLIISRMKKTGSDDGKHGERHP